MSSMILSCLFIICKVNDTILNTKINCLTTQISQTAIYTYTNEKTKLFTIGDSP